MIMVQQDHACSWADTFAAMPESGSPVRVLVVGQTPPPFGGQAVMIAKLLEGNYEKVRLYHVRMAFSPEMDSVGRFELRKLWVLLVTIFRIIAARIRWRPEVLYYPPSGPNIVPVLRDIVLLNSVRWMFRHTVFHFHAGGLSTFQERLPGILRPFYRSAYRNASLAIRTSILAPADGLALGAKAEAVVANGIEDRAGGMIERVKRSNQPLNILFTALLIPSKGVDVLLDSFAYLVKDGLDVRLLLMGRWGDPSYERHCLAKMDHLEITDRVEVLGVRTGEDKHSDFLRSDIFCFPTHFESESFPVVLMEAAQYGLPVVATNWRGLPVMVQEGVTGYLVPIKDPVAVAARLAELVRDDVKRLRMGAASRAQFEQAFTLERFQRNMEHALVQAVEPTRSPQ